jgi:putative endonuclease
MYYVYLLQTIEKDRTYIGYTNDLKRRIHEHQAGKNKSTSGRRCQLKYYEAHTDEQDARDREKTLKSGHSARWLKNRLKNSLS